MALRGRAEGAVEYFKMFGKASLDFRSPLSAEKLNLVPYKVVEWSS